MKKLDKGILFIQIISTVLSLLKIMFVGSDDYSYAVLFLTMIAIFSYWYKDKNSTVKQLESVLIGMVLREIIRLIIGLIITYKLGSIVDANEFSNTISFISFISFIELLLYPFIISYFYRYFKEGKNIVDGV